MLHHLLSHSARGAYRNQMIPNRKILVVDDQEDLRLQVARILRKKNSENDTGSLIEQIRKRIKKDKAPSKTGKVNYQVDTVGQGKQAYELIKDSYTYLKV